MLHLRHHHEEASVVLSTGHNRSQWTVVEPEGTKDGEKTRTCYVCDEVEKAVIPGTLANPFIDIKQGKWYSGAIEWAASNGYAAGMGEGIFGYKNDVTREQLAMFFYTYSEKNGIDVSGRADIAGYSDYSRIHAYAVDAVSWAINEGLISGTGENTLSPEIPEPVHRSRSSL